MEEKKPLESHSLSHTSKELEGQVWAQIGTSSYDPSKKQASTEKVTTSKPPTTTTETDSNAPSVEKPTPTEPENGVTNTETATEEPADCNDTKEESAQSQSNDTEAKKPNSDGIAEIKSRNMLGDGFENNSRSRSRSPQERRRSRSPGRRKKRPYSDYSTNSRNINDLRSRIFIGHLSTDECTKEEVEELFKPYGKILGVNLQHGYGFVQYDDEESVRMAIKQVHGTKFKGSQLVVDRPVALRKIEERMDRPRDYPSRKELMEEVDRLRRKERDYSYHHRDYPPPRGGGGSGYDDRYYDRDRRGGGGMAMGGDYYPGPPTPAAAPYYGGGGYMERGEQYRSGGGGSYDRYHDEPYDYMYDRRDGGSYYGDHYGNRPPPRR